MKLTSKLIAISSVAALIASPLAMAGKADGGSAVCDVADGAEASHDDEVLVDPIVGEDEVVEITLVEGEVIECEAEPISDEDPTVCDKGVGEVPVDWVKRGEVALDNPDVIFQNAAVDGGAEAPVATKGDIELGQDDKAALIEGRGVAAPEVKHVKKGPVALVKKGRVFLR